MKTQHQNSKNPFKEQSLETEHKSAAKQAAEIPAAVTRAMWKDFFEAAMKQTVPDQIFGGKEHGKKESKKPSEQTLIEGEEMSLTQIKESSSEKKTITTTEHREYVKETFERIEGKNESKEETENRQQLEALHQEIQALMKQAKEMETAFKDVSHQVTSSSNPEKVGRYDVNFLEWVLIMVRNARQKVEEGQSWLTLFASKKQQKAYWNQAKSKGTSFTQNSERTVATQTG